MKINVKKSNNKTILVFIVTFILVSILFITLILFIFINKKIGNKDNKLSNKFIYDGITEKSVFPDNVFGVTVHTSILERGKDTRIGVKRKIKYIVLHETDNVDKGANAKCHANYLVKNSDFPKSWHYTVDSKEIYHHVPDNEVAYHAADRIGNLNGIGIELCVNKDGDFEKTFENATKLVAYLIKEYNLDINSIKTHQDFSGKFCPRNILQNNRLDEFKDKVKLLLE